MIIMSFSHDIEKGVNDTVYWANDAYGKFDAEKKDYIIYYADLIVLEAERAALTVSYNSNKSTMRKEAIELASDAIPTSFAVWGNIKDTAKNASIIVITASDDLDLQKALVKKTVEIQKKKVDIAAQLKLVDDTYDHYIDHVDAYNNSKRNSPTTPSDDMTPTKKGKILSDEIGVDTNLSVKCSNPSGKCTTVYTVGNVHPANSTKLITLDNVIGLSEGHHWETCSRDHACYIEREKKLRMISTSPYWNCSPDFPGCPEKQFHVALCKGGCGEYKRYVMKRRSVGFSGYPNFSIYEPHWIPCGESVPGGWPFASVKCSGYYYSCAGVDTCTKAYNHKSNDETASTPSTPTPTPTPTPSPTPSMHACGVHASSVAGNHSLQASCSKTNSHGDSCTVTGFYACQSHTCVFPAPPPTATCASGHSYDPSDSNAVNKHRVRTCQFCGQTWQACSGGKPSVCNKPKRKKKGWKCKAI